MAKLVTRSISELLLFAGAVFMILPFAWGVLSQHILIGLISSVLAWWGLRKLKAGRAVSWIIHTAYWYLPGAFMGLKATPPSHLRLMAG